MSSRRACLALLVTLLSVLPGCAGAPRPRPSDDRVPVLFVHGTADTPDSFLDMRHAFREAGWPEESLHAVRLYPRRGEAPIEVMAYQVRRAAASLRKRTGATRVDVVAFSQGALSSRYWIQELAGQPHVRRFVSISGPHQGTWAAMLLGDPALVQMRPDSDFVRQLNRRTPPWGDTEVFSFWTPFDITVFPAHNAHLPGATERRFSVPLHQMMLSDPRVIAATLEALTQPARPPAQQEAH